MNLNILSIIASIVLRYYPDAKVSISLEGLDILSIRVGAQFEESRFSASDVQYMEHHGARVHKEYGYWHVKI